MKYKFTRFLSLLLSAALIVATPVTSFAVEGNGGGSGSSGGFTSAGDDKSYFSLEKNIGYRFTIVDSNGKTVSKVNGAPGSLDVIWSVPDAQKKFTNTKFEELTEGGNIVGMWLGRLKTDKNGDDIETDFVDRLVQADTGYEGARNRKQVSVPAWVTTEKIVQGEKFKEWMISDSVYIDDSANRTNTSENKSESSGGNTSSNKSSSSSGSSSTSSGGNKNSNTSTSNSSTKGVTKNNNTVYVALARDIVRGFISKYDGVTGWASKSSLVSDKTSILNEIDRYGRIKILIIESYERQGRITKEQLTSLKLKVLGEVTKYKNKISPSYTTFVFNSIFSPITVYAAEVTDVVESITPEGENNIGWAVPLLRINDGTNYILDLDGTKLTAGADGITPLSIMKKNNYKLIVEPIMWGRPQNVKGQYAPYTIYGTYHNWVQYSLQGFEWSGYTHSGGNTMRYTNMLFPNGMYIERDDLGLKAPSSMNSRYDWNTAADLLINQHVGIGLHIYSVNQSSEISTWDKENYPDGTPAAAPDASSLLEESEYGETSKTFKIMKYYEDSVNDGLSWIPVDYFGRTDTPHTVSIDDEPLYSVIEWFTSKDEKSFVKDGLDIDTYTYENQKNSYNDGRYNGSGESKLVVNKDDTEKVLHVLLRRKEETGLNVVKVYETDGITDRVEIESSVEIENGSYKIKDIDGDYVYIENKVSELEMKEVKAWSDTEGRAGTESSLLEIPVTENIKTIYLLYRKQGTGDGALVLHENEISHNFSLKDVLGDGLASTARTWNSVAEPTHTYYDDCGDEDESCPGHDCTMSETDAGTYSFKIENKENYDKSFVYKWKELEAVGESGHDDVSNTWSGIGYGHNGGSLSVSPLMEMTIQRSFNDMPTLYPGMNSNESSLVELGLKVASYKPAGARNGGTEQLKRKEWNNTFRTDYNVEGVDDPEITFECEHDSESVGQSGSMELNSLNAAYSKDGNTKVYGLWGVNNKGIDVPEEKTTDNKWSLNGMNFTSRKTAWSKGIDIKFYPYYKMLVQTLESRDNENVYLTSENLSTLLNYKRVDTSLYKKSTAKNKGYGLDLSSYQWSIHKRVQDGLIKNGITDQDSCLPAGAIYSLSTSNSSEGAADCWVGLRIFSTYVLDKNKLAESGESVYNRDEALSSINGFIEQSKRVLDGYEIVLNGLEGITTNEKDFYKNSKQITGKAGSYKMGKNKLASDSKYDLETGGTGANRSDLDILDEKKEIIDWKITSDADGNVSVYRNDSLLETIKKDVSEFKNSDIKEFDEKTNLVSNYIKAIDRDLGEDRMGASWYNEGFEIGCIEERAAFRLGFGKSLNGGSSEEIRSAALNIKLAGQLDSKSDLYNMEDKNKTRTFKFYTSSKSTCAEAAGESAGWIGNFEGEEVIVPGIHELFTSKLFYTSNGTVNDLN